MAYSSRHSTLIVTERVLTVAVVLLGIGYYAAVRAGPQTWRSDGLFAVVRQILEWYAFLPVVLGLVAAVISALYLRRWYLWLFAIAAATFLASTICFKLAYGPLTSHVASDGPFQPNRALAVFSGVLATIGFITASWCALAVIFDVVRMRPGRQESREQPQSVSQPDN